MPEEHQTPQPGIHVLMHIYMHMHVCVLLAQLQQHPSLTPWAAAAASALSLWRLSAASAAALASSAWWVALRLASLLAASWWGDAISGGVTMHFRGACHQRPTNPRRTFSDLPQVVQGWGKDPGKPTQRFATPSLLSYPAVSATHSFHKQTRSIEKL